MILTFTENAWEDYLFWQKTDKKFIKKINGLIKEIQRTPYKGTGKPESLKYDLAGYWSRRINREHRLIYKVVENELLIYVCKFHNE